MNNKTGIIKPLDWIFKIICVFIAIYPITPDYFRIFGIQAKMLEIIICVVSLLVLNDFKIPIIKKRRNKIRLYSYNNMGIFNDFDIFVL